MSTSTTPDDGSWDALDELVVRVARGLTLDAVEAAGHGHPGTALALAPVMQVLYGHVMVHDPSDPDWPGRDRFVLSAGHASLAQYVQLSLSGYGVSIDELARYRKAGSITPGHPERGRTPGVEITTGPLGQGLASAVGMAMAARREQQIFDPHATDGESPFDHTIWVLAGDGDMQEGVAMEAASLAGSLGVPGLVVVYDDNRITIDGDTSLSFGDDVGARFRAMGWHVESVGLRDDGDVDASALLTVLRDVRDRRGGPVLVTVRSQIAWPAPRATGSPASHGSPLGEDEVRATKRILGLDPSKTFAVPDIATAYADRCARVARRRRAAWQARATAWESRNGPGFKLWGRLGSGGLPEGWDAELPVFAPGTEVATRVASAQALRAAARTLPELWGGGADLTQSTGTLLEGPDFDARRPDSQGRVVHWGIREHAMAAAMNGAALHGPTRIFGGTFLVFSDYMRPALRLAAMMRLPVVHVWSHDSIGIGADGPTHQPVEQLPALRLIPGFSVLRPADATETVAVWRLLLNDDVGPAAVVLARQATEVFGRATTADVRRGAYVLRDGDGDPDVLLIATGSEVGIAMGAARALDGSLRVRVVSMPCREWFLAQDDAYRDSVLPPAVTARVVIEAAAPHGWSEVAGHGGTVMGVDEFGDCREGAQMYEHVGLTVEAVIEAARRCAREGARHRDHRTAR